MQRQPFRYNTSTVQDIIETMTLPTEQDLKEIHGEDSKPCKECGLYMPVEGWDNTNDVCFRCYQKSNPKDRGDEDPWEPLHSINDWMN